ncbi:MAG: hypothetical protein JST00_47435 [Deltaproteobacteria bacterium]|nr:hypothetical protein [Deltaproteobacteria bacterium]
MPTFPKLPSPVAPREVFVVPATFDHARGRALVEREIRGGITKPSDIQQAEIDPPVLLYVPFWRVSASADGFHIGLSTIESGRTGRSFPIPTGGSNHRDAVVMICARSLFPFEAQLPARFVQVSGARPLEVGASELVVAAHAAAALAAGEVVDADVDEARAKETACQMLLRAVSPTSALYSKYEPKVHGCSFCLYPVYYARYRYEGEARRHVGEDFFVAVSAKTGEPIAGKHPSAVRAMATKLRKLLSFDRR